MNVVSVNWRPKLAVLTMLWKVALQHYDVTKKTNKKTKKTSQKEKKQVLTKWFSTKFKKKNQGK